MKIYILFYFLVLLWVSSSAQTPTNTESVPSGDSTSNQGSPIPCCKFMRQVISGSDEWPVQLLDFGGYSFILTNTTVNGQTYSSLYKNYPTGEQVWRYRTAAPAALSSLVPITSGQFIIAGTGGSGSGSALISKVQSSTGQTVWTRSYASQAEGVVILNNLDLPRTHTVVSSNPGQNGTLEFYQMSGEGNRLSSDVRVDLYESGIYTWRSAVKLKNKSVFLVGSSGDRGVFATITQDYSTPKVKRTSSLVRYRTVTELANGLLAVAGERIDSSDNSRIVPAIWVVDKDLNVYDEIRWELGLAGGITSITPAQVADTTFLFVGAVTDDNEAALIRLRLDSTTNQQTMMTVQQDTESSFYQAQAIAPDYGYARDYYLFQDAAFRVNPGNNNVTEVRVQTTRNGRALLYADARRLGTQLHRSLYYGRLPLSLQAECLQPSPLVAQSTTVVETTELTAGSGSYSYTGSTTELNTAWKLVPSNAPQRCNPTTVDGCVVAYPVPTWGYFELHPSPECVGRYLHLEVTDVRGRVILNRYSDGNNSSIVDISAFPRGTYLIRWIDNNTGQIIHTSSVRLI